MYMYDHAMRMFEHVMCMFEHAMRMFEYLMRTGAYAHAMGPAGRPGRLQKSTSPVIIIIIIGHLSPEFEG